ncbi:hypothetical protein CAUPRSCDRAFT_11790 [Caulochytrium protostelioides]|uniref:Beta-catenin-like protein 1 N-terminal domain-containing protein n=1 Tax=Caulochytrium protostelioides TaxID=1555241 RepID=A0A4V1ITB9_9FUNG|nr:hypothetical protein CAUPRSCDRAFT_11790 [Caulochytrium protostelioides]
MSLLIDELKQSRSLKYWTATRQYAAEILSALLMDAEQVRLFLKLDGIDALLTVCACFRKANVALDEPLHQEMTENVFDALAAVLSQPEGRSAFFDAEGIALLLLILKARNVAQRLALKALSYFLSIDAPSIYCDQFVQDMGLGVVMPYLLVRYTPKQASSRSHVSSKQIQKQAEAIEQEDYLIAALWVMFHKLTGSSLVRLIRKFMEKDGEKIDRLLEMLDVRLRRVDVAHDTLTAQHASELYQQSVTAEEREALYESGMLDAGLLSLQQLAYILIVLATLSEENNPDDSANVSSCKASDDVSEPQLGPASQTVFDQASSLAKERILYHFQLEKADPLVLRDVLAVYVDNLENESVEADLCSLLIDNYTSLFASEQKSDK